MLGFKQYLQEGGAPGDKEIAAIIQAIKSKSQQSARQLKGYYIKDGKVGIPHNFEINSAMLEDGELSFALGIVSGNCTVFTNKLTSFKNLPEVVHGSFKVDWSHQCSISALDGIPKEIMSTCDLCAVRDISFKNIHKHITMMQEFRFSNSYKGPLLGLLKIHALKSISCDQFQFNSDIKKVSEMCKYLTSRIGKSILETQEYMIENGMKEWANI